MAKTAHAFIVEALEDLSDGDLKRFRNKLIDRREEPRVSRNAVQNADCLDLADKLVQVFTEPRAIQETVKLLAAIGCNNNAKELESKLSTADAQAAVAGGDAGSSSARPSIFAQSGARVVAHQITGNTFNAPVNFTS